MKETIVGFAIGAAMIAAALAAAAPSKDFSTSKAEEAWKELDAALAHRSELLMEYDKFRDSYWAGACMPMLGFDASRRFKHAKCGAAIDAFNAIAAIPDEDKNISAVVKRDEAVRKAREANIQCGKLAEKYNKAAIASGYPIHMLF